MSKKPIAWNRLDNAAKIFPSNTTKRDTKVFRFSCELFEQVDAGILQAALEETVEYFPLYRCVLRKGVFWNYFEESRLKPVVTQEHRPVCSPLYDPNVRSLLFEVTYFHNRINFEVFHALTDGTGAMQFLKMLVSRYLRLRYPDRGLPALDHDASPAQKSEDSFQKYYNPNDGKNADRKKRIRACQLRGPKLPEGRLGVIEGRLSVSRLLEIAHRYHTTLTVLVSAVLIDAIRKQLPPHDSKRPVVLAIPVNLRNYFDSETARNFFGVINVSCSFDQQRPQELEDIVREMDRGFREGLTRENLERIISGYAKIEKNAAVRIVPLPFKNLVLKLAGRLNLTESTSTVSNIGKTDIPEVLRPYIRMFSVICSTDRLQACLCSCGDLLTVGFSSAFESTEVQKHFFRAFTAMGVPVEIVSNTCEDDAKVAKVNPFKPQKADSCATPEEEARSRKKLMKQAAKEEKRTEKAEKKQRKKDAKAAKKQEKSSPEEAQGKQSEAAATPASEGDPVFDPKQEGRRKK